MGPFFLSDDMKSAINRAVIFVIACAFFYIGIRFTYSDIATSARWYDALGLQKVFDSTIPMSTIQASTDAILFGVALFLLQVYAEYRMVGEKGRNRKIWLAVRLIAGIFDTYTDSDFRSYSFSNPYLVFKSLLVSVFVYNVFSEMALGISLREFMKHWSAFIYVLKEIAGELRNVLGKSAPKSDKPKEPPAPSYQRSSYTASSPIGGDNKYQRAHDLGDKLRAGKIGDDEFLAIMKTMGKDIFTAVMKKQPDYIQRRIAAKMSGAR